MTLVRAFLAALFVATITGAPALADPPREADKAFRETQRGRALPLPQLERRVLPFMGGADHLGPELSGGSYRLKFMENGRVIWVDVDAQTGRILRRSRP